MGGWVELQMAAIFVAIYVVLESTGLTLFNFRYCINSAHSIPWSKSVMIEYRVCNVCLQVDVPDSGKVCEPVSSHTVQFHMSMEALKCG